MGQDYTIAADDVCEAMGGLLDERRPGRLGENRLEDDGS